MTRVVNIHDEKCDVCVMRPSAFGNPFEIGPDGTRAKVIAKYRIHLLRSPLRRRLHELVGKRLGCCCTPDACHASVLAYYCAVKPSTYCLPYRADDLIGQKFGRLTAIEPIGTNARHAVLWGCICDCGTITNVVAASLKYDSTRSCGCWQRELTSANHKGQTHRMTHGHFCNGKPSATYQVWQSMIQRCFDPNMPNYNDYGGRGITVCDRWREFENFLEDMGQRPDGLTLDRYPNNNGNYEPGNCRWATMREQNANRRNNRWLSCFSGANGKKILADWVRISGTPKTTIMTRLRLGWSEKQAVFGRPNNH